MLGILLKIKEIISIMLGLKQIIMGFSKPVKHFEMILGEDKKVNDDPVDILLENYEITPLPENEIKLLEFKNYQFHEIDKLNKKKEALLTEMGNVGKQLQFYRDDLVGISKQIKNTSKFVKNANKFLGGK